MRKYNRIDFVKALEKNEIKAGTEFKVMKGTIKLGTIGVIRSQVFNIDMGMNYPANLLTSDEYEFIQIEEANN